MGRTVLRRKSLQFRGGWHPIRKLALGLLFIALLVGALGAKTSSPAPLSDRAAWLDACKYSGYACFGITRPLVARAPMEELYGRYSMGDTYILVDESIDGIQAYAVTVHEMVHYLQYKHKAWKYTKENSCVMERDAFAVSNAVLHRLGNTDFLVDWSVKRIQYGCP